MDNIRAGRAVPFLPRLMTVMSIPLYLGYLIKHDLIPEGVVFAAVYTWAIVSVVVIPLLCLVECWFVVRTWIGVRAHGSHAHRWHAAGLGIGLGGILMVLGVR